MNNFGQLSLYDFLSVLLVGFLIQAPFISIESGTVLIFIKTTIILTFSYLIGLCWHKVMEYFMESIGLRNNKRMIKSAYDEICGKCNDDNLSKGDEAYYKAYYKLMKKGCLNNIPVLEAQCVFIRNAELPLLFYLILLLCGCDKVVRLVAAIFGQYSVCIVAVLLAVLILVLPILWYKIQMKIYKLVWEGEYYV